ncbi:MAG TPA: YsnF/AvaK domain-containing protein [Chloroflexota bacterium]|nr:YsnF/AvaK domain-containing protein [Chloroflexota bacterium]
MFSGEPYRRDELTTHYPPADAGGRRAVRRGGLLPLEAHVETTAQGCTIRLPVRAEYVRVGKRPVVVEQVVVHTAQVSETAHLADTVRREELHVDAEGDVHVTERRVDPSGALWER